MGSEDITLGGTHGDLVTRFIPNPEASHVVVISHGYGEHGGRNAHVSDHLVARGATVVIPDDHGHGRSAGERVLVTDVDDFATDLHTVVRWANVLRYAGATATSRVAGPDQDFLKGRYGYPRVAGESGTPPLRRRDD
jgi:alpha-beta hydrolase superfamily lysophospholipase